MNKTKIKEPIIIIGAPRSGTTLLFTLLNSHKDLFSLYEESRFIFHKLYQSKLKEEISFDDDSLKPRDCSETEMQELVNNFHGYSFKNRFIGLVFNKIIRKNKLTKALVPFLTKLNILIKDLVIKNYRLVEKTPRNCFKIALLNSIFPDAKFVFLKRDPRSNISSLIEGWKNRKSKQKGNSKRLPAANQKLQLNNFAANSWRFVLPPGWQNHINGSLEELCAFQWKESNNYALADLEAIAESRKLTIAYEDLVSKTPETLKRICDFAGIKMTRDLEKLAGKPPEVNYLDSKPQKDKWKKNLKEISSIWASVAKLSQKLGYGEQLEVTLNQYTYQNKK